MTDTNDWSAVGVIPPEELREDLTHVHWAVQLIAAAGGAFGEARSDDSHRAMAWDGGLGAFVGSQLGEERTIRLGVRPRDLTVMLVGQSGEAIAERVLLDGSLPDGYDWVGAEVSRHLGREAAAIASPEYDMPSHPLGEGAPFTGGSAEGRQAVATLYDTAAAMLHLLISTRDDASPILCWPHHFDLATLLTLGTDSEGRTQTVGVGLAPSGGGFDDWYWYVSPYPYPSPADLPELAGPGHWHTDGWTGAVLPGADLHSTDPAFRDAVVRKFLDVSVEAATRALTST